MPALRTDRDGNAFVQGGDLHLDAGKTVRVNGVDALGGSGGAPTQTGIILLSSTTVDLNEGTVAKQPLYTCPVSRRVIVTNVVFQNFSANPTDFYALIEWVSDDVAFLGITGYGTTPFTSAMAALGNVFDPNTGGTILRDNPVIGTEGQILGLKVETPEGSALTAIVDVFGYLTNASGVPQANLV